MRSDHFTVIQKVCECLLRKGPLTLHNIVRYTELTQMQVKNSLLVLIQHNCVQAFRLADTGNLFTRTLCWAFQKLQK